MAAPDDDWTDDDFQPRERPIGSVEELRASLVERAARDECDSWFVEDLRLFICVRLIQGRVEADIEGELVGWGLDPGSVENQLAHTRLAGHHGVNGHIPTTSFHGRVLAMGTSTSAPGRRAFVISGAMVRRRARIRCSADGVARVRGRTPRVSRFLPLFALLALCAASATARVPSANATN